MKLMLSLRRLMLLAATIVVGVLLGACSRDEASAPDAPSAPGRLALRLSLGDTASDAGSRAGESPDSSNGGYDPGSGYENYLHLSADGADLRIYLFDGDGNYICSPETPEVVRLEANPYPSCRIYELMFDVDAELHDRLQGRAVKLAMLANWHYSYPELTPGQSTVADLCGLADGDPALMEWQPRGTIASADDRIPMFGIIHLNSLNFEPEGLTTWLGTLHLLRSVAKVDVTDDDFLAKPDNGLYITKVELVRYSSRTVMAPQGVDRQEQYMTGSWPTDFLPSVTVPAPEAYEENGAVELTQVEQGRWRIYCPEYRNLLTGSDKMARSEAERTRLRITYSDDPSKTYMVDFKNYYGSQKDRHFNVQRNNWYQFGVSRGSAYLHCVVAVQPYAIVELKPEFGVGAEKPFIPVYNDTTGELECWYDPDECVYWAVDYSSIIENPFRDVDPATGRSIIYDKDGHVLYYYDGSNGCYYDSTNTNIIPNPYLPYDFDTNYQVGRDINGYVSYYYEVATGHYLAPDKATRIPPVPSLRVEDSDTGLRRVVDSQSKILYYYNPYTGCYYTPMKVLMANPWLDKTAGSSLQAVRALNGTVTAYYDYAAGRYLAPDRTTVVPSPFQPLDTESGMTYCRTTESETATDPITGEEYEIVNVVYFFYNPATGEYFADDKVTPISNPLI